MTRPGDGMTGRVTGWLFVAVQAVLLGALIVLPGRADWATPLWLATAGFGLIGLGLVVVALGSVGLGPALTATPVPRERGMLATGGLYRYVRHPIYSGVLAIVAGLTVRSGSWFSLAVAALAVVFFDQKARWEEARLSERYDGYSEYAEVTPRFVPRPWQTSRSV